MSQFATAPRPIRRVLIANRGEIACRIIRTCRRLGLGTIAVYSDADAGALHVRMADVAFRIGPAAAAQSYLDIPALLAAARRGGADAIHPGYGFLSENPRFAAACEKEGIVFVGPSAEVIAAMGSKIEAKKIADAAGVPTVPGYLGADQSPQRIAEEALRTGFPLLIKASAGGGGRGMRRVDGLADLPQALSAAKAEALAAFGDDTVLLERLVLNPRHLEVQLIGDRHGNLLHLFERDCSVQRNNQKVFEEAPAPNLTDAARQKLYDRALLLGRAIGYTSAGTVEFVMEASSEEPYFLEMNTRLQVEHPVTEEITGVDLVEWQLRVAAGLELPARQQDICARGHAIEARIAAERPELGFQPATGTVLGVRVPPAVRLDSGIAEGSEIGLHYDSMIAKLVVLGEDRAGAVSKLDAALSEFAVLGVGTNTGLLRGSVRRSAFAEGRVTTGFLATEFPDGWTPDADAMRDLRAQAAILWAQAQGNDDEHPWLRPSGFRIMGQRRPAMVELTVSDDGAETVITVARDPEGYCAILDDGTKLHARPDVFGEVRGSRVCLSRSGLSIDAQVMLAVEQAAGSDIRETGADGLAAPLPGVVTAILVQHGARVSRGDSLMQMEAMKLVHSLTAPSDGVVGKIHCAVGDTVPIGAPLIDIVPQEEE